MILGSGGVRALVRCPVCQARFRGTAEWSRCGAELTALMLLAAHVCVWRQATRLRSGSTVIALYAKRQFSKIDLCCGGQYAPASHRSRFEPTLRHGPIVAKSRPFPAQKEAVTASASIMPWGRLLIPFAGHKTKNLLIARLFVNRVRFRDFREGLMGNSQVLNLL
jgi:hypothetical protein